MMPSLICRKRLVRNKNIMEVDFQISFWECCYHRSWYKLISYRWTKGWWSETRRNWIERTLSKWGKWQKRRTKVNYWYEVGIVGIISWEIPQQRSRTSYYSGKSAMLINLEFCVERGFEYLAQIHMAGPPQIQVLAHTTC